MGKQANNPPDRLLLNHVRLLSPERIKKLNDRNLNKYRRKIKNLIYSIRERWMERAIGLDPPINWKDERDLHLTYYLCRREHYNRIIPLGG